MGSSWFFIIPLKLSSVKTIRGYSVVVGFLVALTLITSLRCLFLEFDEEAPPANLPAMVLIIKRFAEWVCLEECVLWLCSHSTLSTLASLVSPLGDLFLFCSSRQLCCSWGLPVGLGWSFHSSRLLLPPNLWLRSSHLGGGWYLYTYSWSLLSLISCLIASFSW